MVQTRVLAVQWDRIDKMYENVIVDGYKSKRGREKGTTTDFAFISSIVYALSVSECVHCSSSVIISKDAREGKRKRKRETAKTEKKRRTFVEQCPLLELEELWLSYLLLQGTP